MKLSLGAVAAAGSRLISARWRTALIVLISGAVAAASRLLVRALWWIVLLVLGAVSWLISGLWSIVLVVLGAVSWLVGALWPVALTVLVVLVVIELMGEHKVLPRPAPKPRPAAEQRPREDDDREEDGCCWYQDPISLETMCDPVKCSNGRTFDRWTIVHGNLTRCPYDRSSALIVLVDDIDVRSRIFQAFPDQYERFLSLRREYRAEALERARAARAGGGAAAATAAVVMLDHVLTWARSDEECQAKRAELVARQASGGGAGASAAAAQRPAGPQPSRPSPAQTPLNAGAGRGSSGSSRSESTSTHRAMDRMREILGSQADPELMADAARAAQGDVEVALNVYWDRQSQASATVGHDVDIQRTPGYIEPWMETRCIVSKMELVEGCQDKP